MHFEDYIEIQPRVRSGKPCFNGTRIIVYDALEYLAGGMDQDQLLTDTAHVEEVGPLAVLESNLHGHAMPTGAPIV